MSARTSSVARNREGFTLLEVIVSVVLLGVIVGMLGGLSYHAARTALDVDNGAQRQAYGLEMVNRLVAMTYDSLVANTGKCDTATAGDLKYKRCYTVTTSGSRADVTVTVTPLKSGSYAQSFILSRVSNPTSNPLNMP